MKSLFLFFLILGNLSSACTDNSFSSPGPTGTLVGYVSYPPKNLVNTDQTYVLEISYNGKSEFYENPGQGQFRKDSLPVGNYYVNFYRKAHPDSSRQKEFQINEGMVSFVHASSFCDINYFITTFPEYSIPLKDFKNLGAVEGILDMQDIETAYQEKFGDNPPIPEVQFYTKEIVLGGNGAKTWKRYSTEALNGKYFIDSLPPGFYQGIVSLESFSSNEKFNILVLPNKTSLVDFPRFRTSSLGEPFNLCINYPHEWWEPQFID